MHLDILVFAVIAVFLIYRLNSVLGTKTGAERERPNPFAKGEERPRLAVVPQPQPAPQKDPSLRLVGVEQVVDPVANVDGRIVTGLSELAEADTTFDLNGFMNGCKAAFEVIVTAYSKGNLATLKPLLSPKLYSDFESGVRAREAAGETAETIIHRIKSALLTEAHLGGAMVYLTVRFSVEETAFTRNKEGAVISGSADRIITIDDLWTFTRDIRSSDPNWILIETKAADAAA